MFLKITNAPYKFFSCGGINRHATNIPRLCDFYNTAERGVAQHKIQMPMVAANPDKSFVFQLSERNRVLECNGMEAPFTVKIQKRHDSTLIGQFALDMLPRWPFHGREGHHTQVAPRFVLGARRSFQIQRHFQLKMGFQIRLELQIR